MRAFLTVLFSAALLVAVWVQAASAAPAAVQDGDEEQDSPKGTFSLIQHWDEDSEDQDWTTKLHFEKGGHPDVVLSKEWMWRGDFYISPDDQWVLQVQKSGSGENVAMLFRVDPKGTVARVEPQFEMGAFKFLEGTGPVRFEDLFHTGIEFGAWDLKRGVIRFSLFGTQAGGGGGFRHEMEYDLAKREYRFRDPAAAAANQKPAEAKEGEGKKEEAKKEEDGKK